MFFKLRIFITSLLFTAHFAAYSQNQPDTLQITQIEFADSVFGQLTQNNFPSGLLANRLFGDSSSSAIFWYENNLGSIAANADLFYSVLEEIRLMAVDTSAQIRPFDIYNEAAQELALYQFEYEQDVIPIGLIDYNYHELDTSSGLANGLLTRSGITFHDLGSQSAQIFHEKRVQVIAPMYDYLPAENLYFIVKPQWFITDDQSKTVSAIEILENNSWTNIPFNTPYHIVPQDSFLHEFHIKVVYDDQSTFTSRIQVKTPESGFNDPKELECVNGLNTIDVDGNKISWCIVPSCQNEGQGIKYTKPFLLVTGYRPPLFGQSFKKTWQIYNTEHQEMLADLNRMGYDVFLVKFNIHMKPYSHGLIESADLLIQLINWINLTKDDDGYNEIVIQGSSMGSDIGRLALMKMEYEHLYEGKDHHHVRLFNSYDANFYGASIPLSSQFMIYSGFNFKPITPLYTTVPISSTFLRYFLFASMEQKTMKELLIYHAKGGTLAGQSFADPIIDIVVDPNSSHPLRQVFLNELDAYDTYNSFIPMPTRLRNIAISLGTIDGLNSANPDLFFLEPNESWINSMNFLISAAENSTSPIPFFKHKGLKRHFGIPLVWMNHKIDAINMEEVDNSSGSYIPGFGNITALIEQAYFPVHPFYTRSFFSHKSVLTGLAINKNLWPADGSHTLDMHDLNLMFNSTSGPQSDHFGYPNIGNPTNYQDITPFEAIYVDRQPDPHIRLTESTTADLTILNDFIYDEYEPWHLGLQNFVLGNSVRPDYVYKSKRVAKHTIKSGYDVTHTTGKGNYKLSENTNVIWNAGDFIELHPGFSTDHGCVALMEIKYEACEVHKSSPANHDPVAIFTNIYEKRDAEIKNPNKGVDQLTIYPNPSIDGHLKIKLEDDSIIEDIIVYSTSGNVIFQSFGLNRNSYYHQTILPSGTYILYIKTSSGTHSAKWIVQ